MWVLKILNHFAKLAFSDKALNEFNIQFYTCSGLICPFAQRPRSLLTSESPCNLV